MLKENIEWRDIEGFEDQYQVSNYGDFHIKEYHFIDRANRKIHRLEKYIWSEELCEYGGDKIQGQYLGIHLGGMKKTYAHILAAKAFIENPYNKPEVNHKDGDTKNNYCGCRDNGYKDSNLEWVTRKENMEHASLNGLINHESYLRKITCIQNQKKSLPSICKKVVQLSVSGDYINEFESVVEASEKTGIAKTTIGYVCNRTGYHKTAGGFLWVWQDEYDPNKDYKVVIDQGAGNRKPVIQMDMDGNVIAEYESCLDAARKNKKENFNDEYIGDCCKGKRKTHKKFLWKYKE